VHQGAGDTSAALTHWGNALTLAQRHGFAVADRIRELLADPSSAARFPGGTW